jgi:hypothetical protein
MPSSGAKESAFTPVADEGRNGTGSGAGLGATTAREAILRTALGGVAALPTAFGLAGDALFFARTGRSSAQPRRCARAITADRETMKFRSRFNSPEICDPL